MMSRSTLITLLLVAVLISLYAVRAAGGWVGGLNYARGRQLATAGKWEEALPYLERSTVGANRSRALWLKGEARTYIWEDRFAAGAPDDELDLLNQRAHAEFSEAITLSPASGWYWADLGYIYHQRERAQAFRSGLQLNLLGADRESSVGRSGRIALGMTHMAIEREPMTYTFRDQLAFIYLEYQLRERALEAVRDSARVQPLFRFHSYEGLDPLPQDLTAAFAEASRGALNQTPFLRPVLHLISLGRLEFRRGELLQAEIDLRAALTEPGEQLNRAEANYYLGKVLLAQGRPGEALEALELSATHPNFLAASLVVQADIAEREGRLKEALDLLTRCRRLRPRNLGYLLLFARVARRLEEWEKAEAALKWGMVAHPTELGPVKALVTTYIEMGDLGEAEQALADLRRMGGSPADTERLAAALARARGH
jgi:tetratricopeptide (TPR) repeat protein